MARSSKPKRPQRKRPAWRPLRWLRRMVLRTGLVIVALVLGLVALGTVLAPPTTPYMFSESRRLGGVDYEWVPLADIAPVMARAAVAAEDANFCLHWGFDVDQIRAAIEEGAGRGASTISQQVVKNVYLWHGRSWLRKGLEAVLTPLVEAIWSKRRIVEVYLNVAEFGTGVFGVEAASRTYFGKAPKALTAREAAQLAAVLPAPKRRSATAPSARARRIADGAATINADGRAACFQD